MPLFAVTCRDSADSASLRQRHLDDHLGYIEQVIDRIRVAGPVEGGSLLIVEADSAEDAEALVAADPYARAGVWAEVKAQEFRGVAGTWVGGFGWEPRS